MPIIAIGVIVVLLGVGGYFAFKNSNSPSPLTNNQIPLTQSPSPLTNNQAPSTDIQSPSPLTNNQIPLTQSPSPLTNNQAPSTDIQFHRDYKNTIAKSFDYGNGEQQFGIIRVAGGAGPSSFTTDSRNHLYITDPQNNRVKIFDSELKQILIIKTEPFIDIAVDNNGNIYGYTSGPGNPGVRLLKYSNKGSLIDTLDNPSAFSEISSSHRTYGRLYIIGNKLYITDSSQNSHLVTLTEGNLKSESEKVNGIYGNSGKRYYASLNFIDAEGNIVPVESRKVLVDIFNQSGIKEKTITIDTNGITSVEFLGEDKNGNIYIQIGISDSSATKLQVNKYDFNGNLLTTLDITNSDYSVWTAKSLHVDWATGDIWQVAPGQNKLFVNKWSVIY